ncbi:UbiD family decarboxylase associated with menaquinone via futalosine [Desulfovibrio sp. DV]|uniref:UbiD family decarboxylase domain-containing protein n=1 Tax=Desulfovibrio sp. DV TaxID=1844708 RepID=UPI00096310FF|nr:UbiD family decarboxylase domain-containing protein [Desulfovibrio sp. DV]OLN31015.1 UbiD family decarboxylase associated with menaquinone via futalosine [Desulfovibrio sp. DV]
MRLLEKKGELKRIKPTLDPYLEIAEVTDRVSKAVGPALFFENPKGSRFPVVTNAFGSFDRMHLALECTDLDAWASASMIFWRWKSPRG